jgi:hypothetical protein
MRTATCNRIKSLPLIAQSSLLGYLFLMVAVIVTVSLLLLSLLLLLDEAREFQVVEDPSSVEAPSRETIRTDTIHDDAVVLHVAVRLLIGEAEHLADCHASVVLHVEKKVSGILRAVNNFCADFQPKIPVPMPYPMPKKGTQ